MLIVFENEQAAVEIDAKLEETLRKALDVAAKMHALSPQTEVDITIVDDVEIHELNKQYRNVDRPTDVLSFALDEGEDEPEIIDEQGEHLLGDIIISAETAARQAEEFGHGITREIVYLAVHGLLHLLGYDHMVEADKVEMRTEEEKILRAIALSEEYLPGVEKNDAVTGKLLAAAIKARELAYAPYSCFKVGAAVMVQSGKIFSGCNIENASYGLTCCAERNAIFSAVGVGKRKIKALCVVADTKQPVAPCGACRQVIAEFGIDRIIMANLQGQTKEISLAELLPYGFDAAAMASKEGAE